MIKLENVSKFYKSAETVSVGMQRINLEFSLGEFVAITGESGSGKSTLLNVISGLDGYEEGELYINGEETSHYTIADWERYRGSNIGFVFQNYNIIDSFTVYQNVLLALEVQGYPIKERRARALELIEKVGLISHKNHKASKLSGGQKQRAVIARALAKDCPIIVADEPTGNLDSASGAQVLKLLHDVSKNKLVIVVTHDYEQVSEFATRKIKMHDGEVVEDKKIKNADMKESDVLPGHRGMSFFTLMRFTLRSLFATPKRLVFLILMQMIVMMAFTLVFTWRVSQIRDTEITQSQRFPNVPDTRVLVERRDGTPFTADDLDYFSGINTVEKVYENGLSFYNSLPLYIFQDSDKWSNGLGMSYSSWEPAMGTDAAAILHANEVDGEFPDARNEIIIGHQWKNFQIGETIKIGSSSYYENPDEEDFIGTFTIVGIDRANRNIIYFSDAFLNDPNIDRYTINQQMKFELENQAKWGFSLTYDDETYNSQEDESLSGRRIDLTGESATTTFQETMDVDFFGYIWLPNTWESIEVNFTVEDVDIYASDTFYWARMSPEIADELVNYLLTEFEYIYKIENRVVVSLSVKGLTDGIKTVETIDYETYRTIYPANIPNSTAGAMTFITGLFTGVLLILMGLLFYSIVHAVSKNIMKSRKKDFAIFRSIGTNKSTLAKLVILEQIAIAVISSSLMLATFIILGNRVRFIYNIIQYMEFMDYLTLILLFYLFGAWLGLRFNKKIFQQSVIESIVTAREE
jgi:ABC-type lipoprotein export system ATPase subunit